MTASSVWESNDQDMKMSQFENLKMSQFENGLNHRMGKVFAINYYQFLQKLISNHLVKK